MDLFNKKKVAALRDELTLATARLEATTKQLDDLQHEIMQSYKELTEYFSPKYVKKYFELQTENKILYIQCVDVYYSGGQLYFNTRISGNDDIVRLTLSISELKNLKVITKQEYLKGGNK